MGSASLMPCFPQKAQSTSSLKIGTWLCQFSLTRTNYSCLAAQNFTTSACETFNLS